MATRSFRPAQKAAITDGSQILEKHAHQISTAQLIPRIIERNKKAAENVPMHVNFFQAIRAGRRCSCWDIEDSPDNSCTACYGTGTVGGFDKYGTTLEVVDITRPNISTTNIMPDWTTRRKPTPFTLIDGARFGALETKVPLRPNVGVVDALAAYYTVQEGATIDLYMRAPSDTDWVGLTRQNLAQRLFNPHIFIRAELKRQSPANSPPLLKNIYIRYQNMPTIDLVANVPRTAKSIALQEMGIVDDWQAMKFWMPNTLKSITTEDFLVSVEGKARWKILSVSENAPHGQLTSWDVDVKIVQQHEPYQKVPL